MHKSWKRPKLTRRDKLLARKLAAPDVDEYAASEHIRRECERIQAAWTDRDRERASGIAADKRLEIECVASGHYWLNGRQEVRQ